MTAVLEGGEWSAARLGRTLLPGKTRYPFYRRLGGPQGRSGRAENLVTTGIRSRTVQPVAQSLYRLSYPAYVYVCKVPEFSIRLWTNLGFFFPTKFNSCLQCTRADMAKLIGVSRDFANAPKMKPALRGDDIRPSVTSYQRPKRC